MLVILPLSCYFGITSIPFIAHTYLGQHAEIVVTISKKGTSYFKKHCNGKIIFDEYPRSYLCDIKKTDWIHFRKGDKVKLYGKESVYGFTSSKYRPIDKV